MDPGRITAQDLGRLGFGALNLGFRALDLGLRIYDEQEFRVEGFGFGAQDLRCTGVRVVNLYWV